MDTKPTNSELEILNVLWKIGPCSVRDVHEELNRKRPSGYTTVLKMLQIMADKGLVTRNEKNRAHIYAARRGEDETQRSLMDDLVERAFGGSAHKLALHAIGSKKVSQEELAELRLLLDRLEEKS
jgi:BlaI family penicillinase repressor